METSAGGFIAHHQDPTYRSVEYSIVNMPEGFRPSKRTREKFRVLTTKHFYYFEALLNLHISRKHTLEMYCLVLPMRFAISVCEMP